MMERHSWAPKISSEYQSTFEWMYDQTKVQKLFYTYVCIHYACLYSCFFIVAAAGVQIVSFWRLYHINSSTFPRTTNLLNFLITTTTVIPLIIIPNGELFNQVAVVFLSLILQHAYSIHFPSFVSIIINLTYILALFMNFISQVCMHTRCFLLHFFIHNRQWQ